MRHFPLVKFWLCACLCLGSAAASTLTSVSCSSPGAAYAAGSANCNAMGTNGYASAGASGSVVLPANASAAAVIDAVSTAAALETTARGITAVATSTSSVDIGVIFDTTGPVRNGLLEINFLQNSFRESNTLVSQSLQVASYSVSPSGANIASVWIPIQLGTDFGFRYQQSIIAISDSLSGFTNDDIDSAISLLAFDSNGAAVQLFDPAGSVDSLFTPEPATIGLVLAAGAVGLAVLRRQRR